MERLTQNSVTQFASSGYSPKWCYADAEENKLLNKVVIFVFFAYKKYSRSFCNVKVEPLMADGLF